MSGKKTTSITTQLRKEAGDLRKQIAELQETIDELTTLNVEVREENKRLYVLLDNERNASHYLRSDALNERNRRTFAENELFVLKAKFSQYANSQEGKQAVERYFPNLHIDRSGRIA